MDDDKIQEVDSAGRLNPLIKHGSLYMFHLDQWGAVTIFYTPLVKAFHCFGKARNKQIEGSWVGSSELAIGSINLCDNITIMTVTFSVGYIKLSLSFLIL